MTDTSTTLVLPARTEVVEYRDTGIADRWDYARRMSAAGDLLPRAFKGQIKDPETGQMIQAVVPGKVFLIMETGRMLGVDPMAAIAGINVIEGSASISPALMQALVRRAGHKLRVRVTGSIETGDIAATATLTRADDPEPFEVTWTVHDAIRAGLVQSYDPDERTGLYRVKARSKEGNALPWETYTRSLLKWRAQGEVVRDGAEEVLLGIHYAPEELGAFIRDDGTADVDTVAEFEARERDAIDRVKALADKKDAQALVDALASEGVWTNRVEAEFAAHILKVPDSRPKRPGAPGQTGDPDLDGNAPESSPSSAEPNEPAPDAETPTPAAPKAQTGAQRRKPVEEAPGEKETEEQRLQREADAADLAERARYEREHSASAGGLDMSALDESSN